MPKRSRYGKVSASSTSNLNAQSTSSTSFSSTSRRPLGTLSSRSNTQNQSTNWPRMYSVAVQPPRQCTAGTQMYPPLIVRGRTSATAHQDVYYLFATAVLLDSEQNVLTTEDYLGGTSMASGAYLASSSGSSGTVNFIFPDLTMPYSGTYSFRVDIYQVDYEDEDGAVLIYQTESRAFSVYDTEVSTERPASDERSLIRKLRDQGHVIPSAPN